MFTVCTKTFAASCPYSSNTFGPRSIERNICLHLRKSHELNPPSVSCCGEDRRNTLYLLFRHTCSQIEEFKMKLLSYQIGEIRAVHELNMLHVTMRTCTSVMPVVFRGLETACDGVDEASTTVIAVPKTSPPP